ncbi:hypothetical protein BCEP27_10603 [Burkholderia cepacia]
MSRYQTRRAMLPQPGDQPANLPCRQLESFCRAVRLQARVHHGLDYLQTVEFSHVQCHQCTWIHGRLRGPAKNRPAYRGQNTTFLFSGNATSELGTYNKTDDNYDYVNYDLRDVPHRSLAHLMPA